MLPTLCKSFLLSGLLIILMYAGVNSQNAISRQEHQQTIQAISDLLDQYYVYPSVAREMKTRLRDNYKLGKYGGFSNPASFAQRLTLDLQRVSQDKHLRVFYQPKAAELRSGSPSNGHVHEREAADNYGFGKKKILPGNVGYLELNRFSGLKEAEDKVHETMRFFGSIDAMIIDLRNNRGGSTRMIQVLSSYFFDAKPRHLNSFYWRTSGRTTESWTLADLPEKRYPEIPLYILTSSRTFSAAEEFAYNLKHMKRAVIIGETTEGGAHPGGEIAANELFTIWVPQGKAINPVTGTNWEGVGVKPHVEVGAEYALAKAKSIVIGDW